MPGLHPAGAPLDWLLDPLLSLATEDPAEGPWDSTSVDVADWPPVSAAESLEMAVYATEASAIEAGEPLPTGGVTGFKITRPDAIAELNEALTAEVDQQVLDETIGYTEPEAAAVTLTDGETTGTLIGPADKLAGVVRPEAVVPEVSRETSDDPELTPCPSCGATDGDCTTKTGRPHVGRTRAIEAARAARAAAEANAEVAPEPEVVTEHPPVSLDSIEQRWEMYLLALEKVAEWEALAKACRADVEVALGDREVGTIAGREVCRWEHRTVRRWDQKRFRREHPEHEAGYIVETQERRFTRSSSEAAAGGQEGTEG